MSSIRYSASNMRWNSYKAIIFDMDGVIVDSMPYHFIAWYEALRPWGGIRVTCFDVFAKEGERWDRTLKHFLKQKKIRPTRTVMRKIFSRRQEIFKKSFKRFIFHGAPELLRCLKKKGYRLALVSGTPLDEIDRILPKRLRALFHAIVSGDSVRQGKPHPEPYLKAARVLGVKPSTCVVIENAPYGITSAKRAGMHCIAVTTSLPASYLQEADAVIDSLREIPAFINKSCRI